MVAFSLSYPQHTSFRSSMACPDAGLQAFKAVNGPPDTAQRQTTRQLHACQHHPVSILHVLTSCPVATHVQGGKAIEEIYQKKSQLEHILLRPDTYIGSTEKQQQTLWVHDGQSLVYKNITYAPGLFKIFDEILVNAADNKVRDPSMDMIKVDILPVRMGSIGKLLAFLP